MRGQKGLAGVVRKDLEVNGERLSILEWSDRSQASSGTLVLLHGFTGCAANWEGLATRLAVGDPGLRVIALDLLGHGRSSAPVEPARYAMERFQADLMEALKQLDVAPGEACLLGYSLGGRLAFYAALAGGFRGLILESASPGLADPQERAARRQSDSSLAARIEREGLASFVADWEQLPLFASQAMLPFATRQALHEQRLRNRPEGLANSLRGVGTGVQPALHDRLSELRVPVMLIAGELDAKFSELARQMARELPIVQVRIVEGAGHSVHLEQPERFAELVQEFCVENKLARSRER